MTLEIPWQFQIQQRRQWTRVSTKMTSKHRIGNHVISTATLWPVKPHCHGILYSFTSTRNKPGCFPSPSHFLRQGSQASHLKQNSFCLEPHVSRSISEPLHNPEAPLHSLPTPRSTLWILTLDGKARLGLREGGNDLNSKSYFSFFPPCSGLSLRHNLVGPQSKGSRKGELKEEIRSPVMPDAMSTGHL